MAAMLFADDDIGRYAHWTYHISTAAILGV
jgi:hypothetical protein